jgi:hypothetical protein
MIRDAILAAGVVLSSASVLRLPGLPVGAGEILLALWIGLSALRILATSRIETGPMLYRFGWFWTLFAMSLGIGAFIGLLTDPLAEPAGMAHDAMAYLLMASVTCLAAAEPHAAARMRRSAWFLIAFANAGLVVQLAMGMGFVRFGAVDPWYWDRFRGWSDNPNQAALYCAVYCPIAVHLGMTATKRGGGVLGLGGAILPLVLGRMTKSDTFVMTTAAMIALLLGLRLRAWLSGPTLGLRFAVVAFLALAVPLGLASLLPFASGSTDASALALSLTKDRGGDETVRTANLRLALWGGALRKGLEGGSLGLGPGPHLERPNIPNLQHLPRPFEAHSTILDVFTQGGLLGVAMLLWLTLGTLILLVQTRLDALAALVVALAVFGISHFILRHPIFWFGLALCVAEGCARLPGLQARRGS